MKTVAIIQARMGSTRLPGKIMRRVCGKSILAHVIERVKDSESLDDIIVATTTNVSDDEIVAECEKNDWHFFRGSESHVLERYYKAASSYHADVIVRITSDCPLFDPQILSEMLHFFRNQIDTGKNLDYLSNVIVRTFPRGLDAEIFTFAALEKAYQNASTDQDREHVTSYIYKNPELFVMDNFKSERNLSEYRWTLDVEEDFRLIEAIYSDLYKKNKLFTTQEVLDLLKEKPELMKLNQHVLQKHI